MSPTVPDAATVSTSVHVTVGVLALQGAFAEHIPLLKLASAAHPLHTWSFILVRTPAELAQCSALIIPGGESTAISLIAQRTALLEPMRQFVKRDRKPVWGTCAGLILLAEAVDEQRPDFAAFGGLDVTVKRNYFGRQVESFEADLDLPFLSDKLPFHTIFIRAPVVSALLATSKAASSSATSTVEILARLPPRAKAVGGEVASKEVVNLEGVGKTARDLGEDGDVVAVRQGYVFGTAFHPELTGDGRIHEWWLGEVGKWVLENEETRAVTARV